MAGNLPGVETARRRRFHMSGGFSASIIVGGHGLTRRSTLCLYVGGKHESHLSSSSYFLQRGALHNLNHDEKLGRAAREAKERLDEKFRNKRLNKSEPRRQNNNISESMPRAEIDERIILPSRENNLQLQTEVFGMKKSGPKRLMSLTRFSWKSSEQDDCAVCLEKFNAGDDLVVLPCAHRFHSGCLVPWLEHNGRCPCCRMGIIHP